jgi:hypothetical protein
VLGRQEVRGQMFEKPRKEDFLLMLDSIVEESQTEAAKQAGFANTGIREGCQSCCRIHRGVNPSFIADTQAPGRSRDGVGGRRCSAMRVGS